jgi:hypothetical protein
LPRKKASILVWRRFDVAFRAMQTQLFLFAPKGNAEATPHKNKPGRPGVFSRGVVSTLRFGPHRQKHTQVFSYGPKRNIEATPTHKNTRDR